MPISPEWTFVADTVMGGVSQGQVTFDGDAARLTGRVSLENNGGFIQMATSLTKGGAVLDASEFAGIAMDLRGNGEEYELRVRTNDLTRPWQAYRAPFQADGAWRTVQLPFRDLLQSRTDVPYDPAKMRRLGIVAIGRVFDADVSVRNLRLYA